LYPGLGYEYDPFGPIISIPPHIHGHHLTRHDSFATNLTEKKSYGSQEQLSHQAQKERRGEVKRPGKLFYKNMKRCS
jgi:hypothetical protein